MNNKVFKVLSFVLMITLFLTLHGCGEVKQKGQYTKASKTKLKQVQEENDKAFENAIKKKEEVKEVESENEEKQKKLEENKEVKENSKDEKEDTKDSTKLSKEPLEISEKLFLEQINDIFFNFDDYKDRTIIVEGMFTYFENYLDDDADLMPVVYRNGPGCCGNDGWGGFLLIHDGDFPEDNDWIRVTGKPVIEETEQGFLNLFLKVDSIEVKEERGSEFVTH